MACILHIETSTNVCSVALSQDGECIFNREDHEGPNHAVILGVFVDEALSFADDRHVVLDAVAVSCGPGVCYGRGLKLLAVPTPELMCVPVLLGHDELEEDALLCPMLDARRMEVYATVYDRALRPVRKTSADIVDKNTYRELLDTHPVYFFGNGAAKCMETIDHPNARLIEDVKPLARWMQPLAEKRMAEEKFEDVAYFVPFYLKDFVGKASKEFF